MSRERQPTARRPDHWNTSNPPESAATPRSRPTHQAQECDNIEEADEKSNDPIKFRNVRLTGPSFLR